MSKLFLIEVYKAEREQFNRTRELQWKINISFWTLLVLGINYSYKIRIMSMDWILILMIFLFITYIVFVIFIQRSLDTNKKIWGDAFDLNAELNDKKLKHKNLVTTNKWGFNPWVVLQSSITVVLLNILCAQLFQVNKCYVNYHENLTYWFLVSYILIIYLAMRLSKYSYSTLNSKND